MTRFGVYRWKSYASWEAAANQGCLLCYPGVQWQTIPSLHPGKEESNSELLRCLNYKWNSQWTNLSFQEKAAFQKM